MAKLFSYKEARNLIEFYDSVLKRLVAQESLKDFYGDIMNKTATMLIDTNFFDEMIGSSLKGEEIDYNDEKLKAYLWTIYCYKQIKKYSELCSSFRSTYSNDVKVCLLRLSLGANPIAWIFASKKNKQLAEEAFIRLSQAKNGEAVRTSLNVLNEIDSLKNQDNEKMFDSFWKNKGSFKESLLSYDANLVARNGIAATFVQCNRQYQWILTTVEEMRNTLSKREHDIHASIDYMLAEKMVNTLKGIPIEELARGKTGLKIKFLKDAGYQNLADIFSSSVYQIASCYGISQDAAYTIKNICDGYAKQIKQEQKIKLSADEKTKSSTKVIQTIFDYLMEKDRCDRVNKIDDEFGADLKDACDKLCKVGNGCTWPFYSDEERNEIKTAFDYAKKTMTSEYIPPMQEILKESRKRRATANSTVAWDDFKKDPIRYYNTIEEVYPDVLGTDDSIYGLPEEVAREIQDQCFFPDGLLCTLRRYQEWGVKYILHQEKVLLGDEMGLGKTIQAIATMVSLKNTGATHFVVVCPASVVTNWCREVIKHSRLRVTKIHGVGKTSAFKSWLKTGGVAITNYESASYLKMDEDFSFALLVVDEAHFIKNPGAKRSVNTKALASHANRLLFMTGTALENRVDEMISLISILRPDIAESVQGLAFMSSAPQFRERIAPVYYRRKREDVLTELPDKIEKEEWCLLNPEEEVAYENAVLEKRYADARRVSWNVGDLNKSTKANRLKEIVEEAEAEGRKVLVFSFFLDTIAKIHEFLRGRCLNPLSGSVNVNRRQEILDEFDKAPPGTVLLAQINSGGTGLNIQSASVVVICEPQFKPSIENQAISRAYRMGQARNVLVFRLLAENTIDESLTNVLKEKQQIFDAFADKSVAAQRQEVEVDEKTFGKIINEEIERIIRKRNSSPSESLGGKIVQEAKKRTTFLKKYEYQSNANIGCGKEYYDQIMTLSYDELVQLLINKYGPAKYDYFTNEFCTIKNKKVTRTGDGLYCHHIDEDKAIMLSNDRCAANNPFEYQRADRLVYCNLLEHFMLHILIFEEARVSSTNELEIKGIGGAVNFLCRQLNDLYNGHEYKQEWMARTTSIVKNDYYSYIKMLKRLWNDIQNAQSSYVAITKSQLAMGWDGQVYERILKELE